MGFNFTFFGEGEHRQFNYKPRYYDPEKEERKRIFGKVDGSLDGKDAGKDATSSKDGYTPGKYLSGSFRDGNYQRMKSVNKSQKIIGMVGLVLFFVILYFIAKFYALLLN